MYMHYSLSPYPIFLNHHFSPKRTLNELRTLYLRNWKSFPEKSSPRLAAMTPKQGLSADFSFAPI